MAHSGAWRKRLGSWLLRGMRSFAVILRGFSGNQARSEHPRILVVVEGRRDVEFLRRISAILHREDPALPDLGELEQRLDLVFVPSGGDGSASWAFRFAGLKLPEFHLFDRDVPPATEARQRTAAMVNWRPGCCAVVTSKRALENYLNADAIFEASGLRIEVADEEDVAELVARQAYERRERPLPWDQLPARARKRHRDKAKKWLNTRAVERMTPTRLAQRDPCGEVRSWLATIAALARR